MNQETGKRKNNIRSIVKAVNVLNLLSSSGTPLSLSAMATELNMAKSTLHGIISTLVDMEYIRQVSETGHYQLGIKLFEIGHAIANNWDEKKIAEPLLKEIAKETLETVHMGVLSDGEMLYIHKFEPSNTIRIFTAPGVKLPCHCTGLGKVLFSGLSKEQLMEIIKQKPLKSYTDHTITDVNELLSHLEQVRENGYAIDDQELIEGLRCIAVPIYSFDGSVSSAISISGPPSRMKDEKLEKCINLLKKASRTISEQLGYRGTI